MTRESQESISQHDPIFLTEMLHKHPEIFFIQLIEDFDDSEDIINRLPELNQALQYAYDHPQGDPQINLGQYVVMGPPALAGDSTFPEKNLATLQKQINNEQYKRYMNLVNALTNRVAVIRNWLEEDSQERKHQELLFKYLAKHHAKKELINLLVKLLRISFADLPQ